MINISRRNKSKTSGSPVATNTLSIGLNKIILKYYFEHVFLGYVLDWMVCDLTDIHNIRKLYVAMVELWRIVTYFLFIQLKCFPSTISQWCQNVSYVTLLHVWLFTYIHRPIELPQKHTHISMTSQDLCTSTRLGHFLFSNTCPCTFFDGDSELFWSE